eukprot:Phypoly_transcript_15398.p2 GENE.Phypoly_transcript_15398~~Phypoly_transcript_15398.p2  ORF type:complete len:135 (-),score=10.44 Phypoly_transcript_15398:394-798(-)
MFFPSLNMHALVSFFYATQPIFIFTPFNSKSKVTLTNTNVIYSKFQELPKKRKKRNILEFFLRVTTLSRNLPSTIHFCVVPLFSVWLCMRSLLRASMSSGEDKVWVCTSVLHLFLAQHPLLTYLKRIGSSKRRR